MAKGNSKGPRRRAAATPSNPTGNAIGPAPNSHSVPLVVMGSNTSVPGVSVPAAVQPATPAENPCPLCRKCFTKASGLKRHYVIHLNAPPSSPEEVALLQTAVEGITFLTCDVCRRHYARIEHYTTHMFKEHGIVIPKSSNTAGAAQNGGNIAPVAPMTVSPGGVGSGIVGAGAIVGKEQQVDLLDDIVTSGEELAGPAGPLDTTNEHQLILTKAMTKVPHFIKKHLGESSGHSKVPADDALNAFGSGEESDGFPAGNRGVWVGSSPVLGDSGDQSQQQ